MVIKTKEVIEVKTVEVVEVKTVEVVEVKTVEVSMEVMVLAVGVT